MAERIEFHTTPNGGEHTKPTAEVKKEAWDLAETLGLKEGANMSYSGKTGAYALTFAEGADEAKLGEFRDATAQHRTDEAKAELAAALPGIKAEYAAGRDEKAPAEKAPAEKAPKAPKAEKGPDAVRTSIALFPTAVKVQEGQDAAKAAAAAMLKESDRVIESLGLKGVVKNSYSSKDGNWVVGGNDLKPEAIKGLEDGLKSFRTKKAENAWRKNGRSEKAVSAAKGPEEGVDVAAAAKDKGVGR